MVGKDLIMATLFGGGSSSSGSGGGGGSVAVSPKEVNFYDYDGTCVYAYSVAEAQKLSELPAGPEHPGLVFQGWNWSLEGVKGLTRAMNIGAMYTTDDGTTRLYITLHEGRTSPKVGVGVNGTVTVDWGDGTEPDVLTGTNTGTTQRTPNHAYAAPGDYVIRLTVDGEMRIVSRPSNDYSGLIGHNEKNDARNHAYFACVNKIEIGEHVTTVDSRALSYFSNMAAITMPNSVTNIGATALSHCYSLKCAVIPQQVEVLGESMFLSSKILETICFSENTATIGGSSFSYCYGLKNAILPSSVTSVQTDAFSSCSNISGVFFLPGAMGSLASRFVENTNTLREIIIEEGVTEIKSQAFGSNKALTRVVFPSTFAALNGYAFTSCSAMRIYDFTACVAVPTLGATTVFGTLPADCEIRVPAALYDEWIAATNWATYASYIKAY